MKMVDSSDFHKTFLDNGVEHKSTLMLIEDKSKLE